MGAGTSSEYSAERFRPDDDGFAPVPRSALPGGRVILEISDDEEHGSGDERRVSDPRPNGREPINQGARHPRSSRDESPARRPEADAKDFIFFAEAFQRTHTPQDNKRTRRDSGLPQQSPYRSHVDRHDHHRTTSGSRDPPLVAEPTLHVGYQRASQQAADSPPNNPAPAKKHKQKKPADEPPYFVDTRYQIKMYRGPGFEEFPVALGTVPGHESACKKWDYKQVMKQEKEFVRLQARLRGPFVIHGSDSESTDDTDSEADDAQVEGGQTHQQKCLNGILEVFPDIEVAFVNEKIDALRSQPHDDENVELAAPVVVENIIAQILEMQTYPKESSMSSFGGRKPAAVADDGTGITITWNRSLPKNDIYFRQALVLLAMTFDRVPTVYIYQILEDQKSIFDAYVQLEEVEAQYFTLYPRPYDRLARPRKEVEGMFALTARDFYNPNDQKNRVNELQAAKQHVARLAKQNAARKAKEEAEARNLAEHKATGAIIECQCCFDDEVPLNRMASCTADPPHFFCFTCIEALADNQVGLLQYEMRCMDGSGCASALSNEGIGKAVPITTFDRLQMNRQHAEIRAAEIEGLEQCQWCDYQAVCEDVEKEPIFYCGNSNCKRATCRKCKGDSHLPKTCEEYKKDKAINDRHFVEEARSDAVIRTCPKCKVKIIKEFGCNKMICSNCNNKMCYECKADISSEGPNPYLHFNRPGSKCSLYDDENLQRHEAEANHAEAEAIRKAKERDANVDESTLRIDTGKERKPGLDYHPAADVFYRGMHHRAAQMNPAQQRMQEQREQMERMRQLLPRPEVAEAIARAHRHNAAHIKRQQEYEVRMEELRRRAGDMGAAF